MHVDHAYFWGEKNGAGFWPERRFLLLRVQEICLAFEEFQEKIRYSMEANSLL